MAFIYSSTLPYPKIEISNPNPIYGKEMLSNVGGIISEMTSIALYFYNNLVTEENYKEVSEAFEGINDVEYHHLKIFGELSLALGEDPRLWEIRNNSFVYWSPGYTEYSQNIITLLENSLDTELLTIKKYQDQMQRILDINIVEILERIIIDEKLHVQIFNELLSRFIE